MGVQVQLLCLVLIGLTPLTKQDCGCDSTSRESSAPKSAEICESPKQTDGSSKISHWTTEKDMALIPGGIYSVGTNAPVFATDNESPERNVTIEQFLLDKFEVSNRRFKEFVDETGYKTEAETFGDSFVFQQFLSDTVREQYQDFRVAQATWWYKIKGANWQHPEGPESDIAVRLDHPVVHVSWKDAAAYCKWMGKRLPTEAEWEIACRGGRKQKLFPWGNKLNPKGEHWYDANRMNIWQGTFPELNTGDDGYVATNPVDQFPQNIYELHNIVGNVWEWTSDMWHSGSENDRANPERVKKGGSYLCHLNYCFRYRCAARSQNTEDSSADNLGFRCAKTYALAENE